MQLVPGKAGGNGVYESKQEAVCLSGKSMDLQVQITALYLLARWLNFWQPQFPCL